MIRKTEISRIAAQWGRHRKGQARILILDIETAPILANVWRIWKENVGLNQIQHDWFLLSFAAKWLGEEKIMYFDQSRGGNLEDDARTLVKLHDLLDQADIVVAHNGRKFDVKKINARFIQQGFQPPSPFKIVDTLEIAKARFAFTSNRLEYIADKLNTDFKKLKHGKYPGFELWKAVMRGDREAWKEMRVYNEHDVLSLEETYLVLRPWDDRHPNVNAQSTEEGQACPICGGDHLHQKGYAYTNTGKFHRYRCVDCGAWSRGRYTVNTLAKRKALLSK